MPKELDVIPSAGRVRTVGELEEEDRDDADEKVIHDVCGWDKVISVRALYFPLFLLTFSSVRTWIA